VRKSFPLVPVSLAFFLIATLFSCDQVAHSNTPPRSASGVQKVNASVVATSDFKGKKVTLEQSNILIKYDNNNDPTAVKHLYVISSYSGDCLLYSTVKGKVTSSGKRLTPYSVVAGGTTSQYGGRVKGVPVVIGGQSYETTEVLQDDGTYGSSNSYLLWVDARGAYHEHYISGGTFVHVSDVPMAWPKIVLNLEEISAPNGK